MAKKTTAAATATPAAVAAETPAAADPQGHEHDDGLEDGFAAPAIPVGSDGATERRGGGDEGGGDGGQDAVEDEGGGVVAAATPREASERDVFGEPVRIAPSPPALDTAERPETVRRRAKVAELDEAIAAAHAKLASHRTDAEILAWRDEPVRTIEKLRAEQKEYNRTVDRQCSDLDDARHARMEAAQTELEDARLARCKVERLHRERDAVNMGVGSV